MTTDYSYHRPVLLKASVDGLITRTDGIYVDATFGGGGHSREILERLEGGKLIAFDQDREAEVESAKIENRSFTFCRANFRHLKQYLRLYKAGQVDGILADLGISSHQIDTPERGFSTRYDADLDMRMNDETGKSAAELINEISEKELHKILGMYGEIKNAKSCASAIVSARASGKITTVEELKEILKPLARRGRENQYYAQVFQAFRISVNDEMDALKEFLEDCGNVLKKGGRLVVISYHSLEDRMVKNYMRTGNISGKQEKDMYGNLVRPFEPVTRKPVMADENEIMNNNRARSARLRIAEKL